MDQADLERLLMALRRDGFRVIGPTPREGAVRLGDLESTQELPWGVGDEQEPGRYRLTSRARGAFGHTVGQDSFKRFFLAPSELLWRAERRDSKLHFTNAEPVPEKLALFGVRACDLAAIEIQDQVLLGADPRYRARREGAFVVAVSCTVSSGSCFCASMGTGPRASRGFDLALVELDLEAYPEDTTLHTMKAQLLLSKDDKDGARKSAERALELDAHNRAASRILEQLK